MYPFGGNIGDGAILGFQIVDMKRYIIELSVIMSLQLEEMTTDNKCSSVESPSEPCRKVIINCRWRCASGGGYCRALRTNRVIGGVTGRGRERNSIT